MGHLWQRFLLTCALLVGLAIGVAATVFGYSNLGTVDVRWSVLQLNGVPLWAVAVVPVVVVLVLGTVYHWLDGLHHFTEHMRHRHRVRELEAEITRLREHLDHVLEMPRGDRSAGAPASAIADEAEAPALPAATDATAGETADDVMSAAEVVGGEPASEPATSASTTNGDDKKKPSADRKKRSRLIMEPEPEPAQTNGVDAEPVTASKEG